jgi:glycosyltransferase involved in cell wall biosynthesis
MKLSIVIPCYNEKDTIENIVSVVKKVNLGDVEKEIIIVDDCSKDGTREILETLKDNDVKVILHEKNKGKGGALKTGYQEVSGDIVIVQDADLEYDPNEYPALIKPILEDKADVVYGSRYLMGNSHQVHTFWHSMMNQFLTYCSNMLSNLWLTDMETCYKVYRTDIVKNLDIKEKRFGIEPEVTAKIAKLNIRVHEVAISYYGRS